jgi:general secretion pathway protein B
VVNGVPVIQGAVVAGARIEEILPDRVRFTQDSRSFEIFLGKTAADK